MLNKLRQKFNNQVIELVSFVTLLLFISIHMAYLILFLSMKCYFMAYFNVGSIIFYLIMILFQRKRFYGAISYLTMLEIDAHMVAGCIYLGFETGFPLCIVGLPSLICAVGYFSMKERHKFKVIPSCILQLVIFIGLYCYSNNFEPQQVLSSGWRITLVMIHTVITFTFIVGFLIALVMYALVLEDKILKDSRTDKLTALPNRKALEEFYDKIKDNRKDYILAICDIDNFKSFNDKNGHLCGDYVLKEIARISKEKLEEDFICRWGGEEFVILSRITDSYDDAIEKLDSVRHGIEVHNFKYYRKNLKSTITMGAQTYEDGIDLDEWIRLADSKLYNGKKNGKNQLVS